MSKEELRKEFMKKEYWKFWLKYNRQEDLLHDDDCDRLALLTNMFVTDENFTALDVRCGGGRPYFDALSGMGIDVTGADISKDALGEIGEKHPKAKTVLCDFENSNFKDRSFDIVYCFRTFKYFPNQLLALRQMLRTAGKYVLFDVDKPDDFDQKMRKRRKLPRLKNILTYFQLFFRNPKLFAFLLRNDYEVKSDLGAIEEALKNYGYEKVEQKESIVFIIEK